MRNPFLVALTIGCSGQQPVDTGTKEVRNCPNSLEVGAVEVLSTGFEKTEGLVFSPDGRLFVSAGDIVAEIQPDGTWSDVAELQGGVGLAWWGGLLVAAGYPDSVGSVVTIDVDSGEVQALSNEIASPRSS